MAYEIDKINYLQIGVQGENIARKIEIDMTKWVQELEEENVSGYSFSVIFKPYNDPNKYPMVTTYNTTTKILTWKIGSAATQTPGVGYTEVRAQEATSGLVKKTRIIPTSVEESVSGNETDPPEVQEGWVTNVLNAGTAAVNANTAAQAAKTAAETARDAAQAAAGNFQDLSATVTGLAAGANPTINVTHSQGGYYNIAFGIPKGEKGAQGDPAPSGDVASAVDAYLAENFSNPSNPPLDRTLLTVSSAAPADMAGDIRKSLDNVDGVEVIYFVKNYYINTSGNTVNINSPTVSTGGYRYAVVDCSEGDEFTITGQGGSTPRLWCFIDSSGNVLSVSASNLTRSLLIIKAPANASKLVLNSKADNTFAMKGITNGEKITGIKEVTSIFDSADPSVIKNNLLLGFPSVNRSGDGISVTGTVKSGITIYGTASDNAGIRIFGNDKSIKLKGGKTYLYYGAYTGNKDISSSTWQLTLRLTSSVDINTYTTLFSEGVAFSVVSDTEVIPFIRVANGQSVNVTVYPVLVEYSAEIAEIINNAANRKGINILPMEAFADTSTSSGVTATNNHDGTFTITGANSSAEDADAVSITNNYGFLLEAGHRYLFCSNGDNHDILPGQNTYRMDIRKISATGTPIAYEYALGGIFEPDTTDIYKFMLRFAGGYSFSNLTITPVVEDITYANCDVDNSARIRVCTYNVGNFSNGASGTAQGNDAIYRGLINAFQKCDADIYLFSEWDDYWNYANSKKSEDVFARLKPYHSEWTWNKTGKYIAQMIYSDYPYRMERHNFFNDGHTRHYVDDIVIIKGKPVHFISTHLNANDLQSRYDDYDKLKTYLESNGYDYYVIAGDFNHGYGGSGTMLETARDEIDYMEENLDTESVQGGFYGALANDGFMNTYSSGNDTNDVRPYDNIFVSKNIRIRNAFVVETAGSDHYPLCADIEIL